MRKKVIEQVLKDLCARAWWIITKETNMKVRNKHENRNLQRIVLRFFLISFDFPN